MLALPQPISKIFEFDFSYFGYDFRKFLKDKIYLADESQVLLSQFLSDFIKEQQ